jgi:hypothetical protein
MLHYELLLLRLLPDYYSLLIVIISTDKFQPRAMTNLATSLCLSRCHPSLVSHLLPFLLPLLIDHWSILHLVTKPSVLLVKLDCADTQASSGVALWKPVKNQTPALKTLATGHKYRRDDGTCMLQPYAEYS